LHGIHRQSTDGVRKFASGRHITLLKGERRRIVPDAPVASNIRQLPST
jgi:hypothetical protein